MLTKIEKSELPNKSKIRNDIFLPSPDIISILFHPESLIPVAFVCLRDVSDVVEEIDYALNKGLKYYNYIVENKDDKNLFGEVFCLKFYSDDIAVRLYSASEHLANAIINFYEIKIEDLKKYKKGRSSLSSILGQYLNVEKTEIPIKEYVSRIYQSEDFKTAIKYRNKWVHDQPPLTGGLGIIYQRKIRWEKVEGTIPKLNKKYSYNLNIGGTDKPDIYPIDHYIKMLNAYKVFLDNFSKIFYVFRSKLVEQGFNFEKDKVQFNLKNF